MAVKVRHPGIEAAIRADFKAAAIGKVMARALAPGVDIAEVFEEAQASGIGRWGQMGVMSRRF